MGPTQVTVTTVQIIHYRYIILLISFFFIIINHRLIIGETFLSWNYLQLIVSGHNISYK